MNEVQIRPFLPRDRDWVVAEHAERYAQDDGFDDSFGVLVSEIVDAFIAGHDPTGEAGWIAARGDARLGSIFCVRLDAETAKLRLFYLTPEARGQGLGQRLLATCTGFAKSRGYRRMKLWTHESHRAACALYAATGWTLDSAKPVSSFGQPLVEQIWSLSL